MALTRALTLAIAVDAIGADKVQAVMMPYTYTAQISVEDAAAQAKNMGVTFGIAEIQSNRKQLHANPVSILWQQPCRCH